MLDTIRTWKIHRKSDKTIFDIAMICNPVFRGWYNYFSCVNPSETHLVFKYFNAILYRWGRREKGDGEKGDAGKRGTEKGGEFKLKCTT
jgi:RNA-directed DNA polymerase